MVRTVSHLQLMGYEENSLAFGDTLDGFMEDMGTNTSVDGTQGVVQEENGPLAVEGTSQAHSLTLPSTQVGTSLSNLRNKKDKTSSVKLLSCCGCTELQTVT